MSIEQERAGRVSRNERFVADLREVVGPWLERSFGYHAAQIGGEAMGYSLLSLSRIHHRVLVGKGADADVLGASHALPFDAKSLDLLILPYTLEASDNPHAVLREVERVLLPDGRLIIMGRDPWTFLDFGKAFLWRSSPLYSQRRIREWLRVLGYEGGRAEVVPMLPFSWPIFIESWPKLEHLLRGLSAHVRGSYVLLVSKKESGMTPIATPWRVAPRLVAGGLAEPAARGYKNAND